jgi:glutamyl-tRNA synthetase
VNPDLVRVRIAPSPTGLLHVGNARAALFNWLFARHHRGVFIVRIDDTDLARSTTEFEEDALDGLRWLGLEWDEGVGVGGPYGTYRQSDRIDRYRQVADDLIERGRAYACFCTPDELAAKREAAEREGRPPGYDGTCSTIASSAAAQRRDRGEPASTRFAVPRPGLTQFDDLVRGAVRFDHETIDDFVLLRSDGTPTYHLASTVDDVDYEISHVARGEDLLPSTPRHIMITEAMGAVPPNYAHLPLLFGPDGRKLSKRHGDVSLRHYRQTGYLPEAMFNAMALLGWSYAPEVTIFSAEQAVERFELSQVSKNPAVFDIDKLGWINGEYMRALPLDRFLDEARPFLVEQLGAETVRSGWDRFVGVAPLIQERVRLFSEVPSMAGFLFVETLAYDEDSWAKLMSGDQVVQVLDEARRRLDGLEHWEPEQIEAALRAMLEEIGIGARKGLQPLRVAITGSSVSPPLFESMAALGRDATFDRLAAARARLAAGD